MEPHRPDSPPIQERNRVLVVGLGNPGAQYARTRHNAGFFVVDRLAGQENITWSQVRFTGKFGDGVWMGKRLFFLKPQTYMNLSGQAVSQAVRYLNLEPGALVVVHDDIDLPLGKIRVKWAGGNGGHKGLQSIDRELGHPDYFRVRIGVGRPPGDDVIHHVLSGFSGEEVSALGEVIEGAVEALRLLLTQGLTVAQNLVNGATYWTAPTTGG